MVFDEEAARREQWWFENPYGQYLGEREERLLLKLIEPQWGETFLEIGCSAGRHLLLFHRQGCRVTGTDPSPSLLQIAAQVLGDKADLRLGRASDLPFSDNEFDIVSLMLPLTFADDAEKAVSEAVRVSRGRVFIGLMNKFSLAAVQLKAQQFIGPSGPQPGAFFHIGEMKSIVRRFLPGVRIHWGSVIFLPVRWYGFAVPLEEFLPVMKNPFGAFLGLSFPITYNLRTVQDIISNSFELKAERGQPARGIIRGR